MHHLSPVNTFFFSLFINIWILSSEWVSFSNSYYVIASSLKKLAEKGCWDVAERKTNKDKQLIEYLVSFFQNFTTVMHYFICYV